MMSKLVNLSDNIVYPPNIFEDALKLVHQVENSDGEDSLWAEILNQLLHAAPTKGGKEYIADQIIRYSSRKGGLERLAAVYMNYIVLPLKFKEGIYQKLTVEGLGKRLRFYDPPTYTDIEKMMIKTLERDGHRCKATGGWDSAHVKTWSRERRVNNTEYISYLRVYHIIPSFKDIGMVIDETEGMKKLTLRDLWIRYAAIDLMELAGDMYHHPRNRISLDAMAACDFDKGKLWFEAVEVSMPIMS
ncbi:hypothetical protein CVT24_004197 [Panaeolus cyanescens]|uniref:HNH nuclease domain-containing protein n=1 Tax=Panaeolus cyanescens TaxID=181874 RepID=A0A409WSW6_9AGAR|nr:hypothetical protein CVT24_004197 [Panaeolus cyanescens]